MFITFLYSGINKILQAGFNFLVQSKCDYFPIDVFKPHINGPIVLILPFLHRCRAWLEIPVIPIDPMCKRLLVTWRGFCEYLVVPIIVYIHPIHTAPVYGLVFRIIIPTVRILIQEWPLLIQVCPFIPMKRFFCSVCIDNVI